MPKPTPHRRPLIEPLENRTLLAATLLRDIVEGPGSPAFESFFPIGQDLYFNADDGTRGRELWRSGGAAVTTDIVEDIRNSEARALLPRRDNERY